MITMPWWGYVLACVVASITGRQLERRDARRRDRQRRPYRTQWKCPHCRLVTEIACSDAMVSLSMIDRLKDQHDCQPKGTP